LEAELTVLVNAVAPWLLEVSGVGALERRAGAGQLVARRPVALRGRLAALAGTNPIPASSGQVVRHRLNRGGDRQLNRALHTILLVRLRTDPDTRAYMARRTAEGKSRRDAKRCLRRIIARQLCRLLERYNQPGVEILPAA
jgi:transposase